MCKITGTGTIQCWIQVKKQIVCVQSSATYNLDVSNTYSIYLALSYKFVSYSCSWQTMESGETSMSFLAPLSLLSRCSFFSLWSLRTLKVDAG